jgi:hypothetical protein
LIERDDLNIFHERDEGVGESWMRVEGARDPEGGLWERRKYRTHGMWTAWAEWKQVDHIPSTG